MAVESIVAKVLTSDDPNMPKVRQLVALGYSVLADPPLDPARVEEELLDDRYQPRAIQIAAFKNEVIVGAVRLVRGSDTPGHQTHPLEAMGLMELNGASPPPPFNSVGEITRFTVSQAHRQQTIEITQALWQEICQYSRRTNLVSLFAIMPEYVVKICQKARINITSLGGDLSQSPGAVTVQNRYPIYWKEHHPKFHQLHMPQID